MSADGDLQRTLDLTAEVRAHLAYRGDLHSAIVTWAKEVTDRLDEVALIVRNGTIWGDTVPASISREYMTLHRACTDLLDSLG